MNLIKNIYLWFAVCFFGESLTESEIQAHIERMRAKRKTASDKRKKAIADEITYWNAQLLQAKNNRCI
jgi:high-affinity K+ transport system ATPase subunit B